MLETRKTDLRGWAGSVSALCTWLSSQKVILRRLGVAMYPGSCIAMAVVLSDSQSADTSHGEVGTVDYRLVSARYQNYMMASVPH